MEIRIRQRNLRTFAAVAVTVCLVAFGVACDGPSPGPGFLTPDPQASIPSPEVAQGIADLSVWVPDGWRSPINFDEGSLEIMVAWANRGTAMAEDYSVVLTSDGQLVHQWDKPLLAPGSERVEILSLNDLPDLYQLVQGRHRLELILDPNESVPELDRQNNTFSLTREFRFRLPDLWPSSPRGANWQGPVVFGGSDVIYGQDVGAAERGYYLAFGVAYKGAERAQAWPQQHSIEVNDYRINQWEFFYDLDSAPSPGDVQVHAVPIWKVAVGGRPLLLGDHRFTLNIDESNAVVESDEQNNALAGMVRLEPSRPRALNDAPDAGGPMVHSVYAIPAGAVDEQWDINGTIESIVADLQDWLRKRTGGRGVVWDETDGSLDITFVQLEISESNLAGFLNIWKPIAQELYRRGFNDPNKTYAVWLPTVRQGGDSLVCGVQTEYESVAFSFTFFKRVDEGENICVNQPVTMVHELFHAFGAAAPCSTNYVSDDGSLRSAHVDDDPNDLMYSGDRFGIPIELDQDRDDYFEHDIPGCIDVADSPYLEPRG